MKHLILSIIILYSINSESYHDTKKDIQHVSLVELICNPDKYNGKFISVSGYFKIERDGEALYINKDDYEYLITKNAISVIIYESQYDKMHVKYGDEGYAEIMGYFNANKIGRYNLFSGAIEKIESIQFKEKRIDNS